MLFSKTVTLVLWVKALNGYFHLSVTPVRTDSLVKLILGKRQNVIFLLWRNICLFLVLELEDLSTLIAQIWAQWWFISPINYKEIRNNTNHGQKCQKKKWAQLWAVFGEFFISETFTGSSLSNIHLFETESVTEPNAWTWPFRIKLYRRVKPSIPFWEKQTECTTFLKKVLLKWPIPILLWLARPNWTLFLTWLMWCTQKPCIIVDF